MKSTICFFIIAFASAFPSLSWSAANSVSCKVINIASFSNRVHLKCQTATSDGVQYFAVSSTAIDATAVFAVASAAFQKGEKVKVSYDNDNRNGETYSCNYTTCREISSVIAQ